MILGVRTTHSRINGILKVPEWRSKALSDVSQPPPPPSRYSHISGVGGRVEPVHRPQHGRLQHKPAAAVPPKHALVVAGRLARRLVVERHWGQRETGMIWERCVCV